MANAVQNLGPQDQERRSRARFVAKHAEPEFKAVLSDMYAALARWNADHFYGRLIEPHLEIGVVPPRTLVSFSETTGYGAPMQITLPEGLVFGTNRDWVVNPWPSPGADRFIKDLLLRATVRQYVREFHGLPETGNRGFGPHFTEEANRIGLGLGLPPVVVRRRGDGDRDEPVCTGWPHNVRPDGYYGDDVTEAALEMAAGVPLRRGGRTAPPNLGAWELILFLLNTERTADLKRLAANQIAHLGRLRGRRFPVLRKVEEGAQEPDGTPIIGKVVFSAAWLAWNDGTVRKMCEAVHEYRTYCDLPIMADALEEAGCEDGRILRHLRASTMEHDSRCWVLKGLIEAAERFGGG